MKVEGREAAPGLDPGFITTGTVHQPWWPGLLLGAWVQWTSAREARAEGHGNDQDCCRNPCEDSPGDQETLQGWGQGPAFIWVLTTIDI